MGMRTKCLRYFHEILELTNISEGNICILGATRFRPESKLFFENKSLPYFKLLEDYLRYLNFYTASIDRNDKRAGLQLDLCNLIPIELLNQFHVIIDAGTSEHILDQYILFKNKHDMLKKGGVLISILPFENSYNKHGSWKYSIKFFDRLCMDNGYKLLDIRITSNRYFTADTRKGTKCLCIYSALQKINNNEFISRDNFYLPILDEEGRDRDLKVYYGSKS